MVLASDEDDTLRNYSGVDLSLLCGNERCEVGEVLHYLFPEVAQPVCSPAYLADHGPFAEAESLYRKALATRRALFGPSAALAAMRAPAAS